MYILTNWTSMYRKVEGKIKIILGFQQIVEWLFLDSNILVVNAYFTTHAHYTSVRICIKFHIWKHCIAQSIRFFSSPLRLIKWKNLYVEVRTWLAQVQMLIHRFLMTELRPYPWGLWLMTHCSAPLVACTSAACYEERERVQILHDVQRNTES